LPPDQKAMVRYPLLTTLLCLSPLVYAQVPTTVEVTEHLEGLCDSTAVYDLFYSYHGVQPAVCTVSKMAIQARLNSGVTYHKEDRRFKLKDDSMITAWISCEGRLLKATMNSKSAEFNQQVEAVFRELEGWTAGRYAGKAVDSVQRWGIILHEGYLFLR